MSQLTFNLVKFLEQILDSSVTVLDAFPEEESASLPIVVVQHLESPGRPAELGGTLENMDHSYNIQVLGKNKGQRDELLVTIYKHLRDDNITFYDLKVVDGKVVLDQSKPLTKIFFHPRRYRPLPAISEHPYDRYRGIVDLVLTQMF
jgi:hypothetical protein